MKSTNKILVSFSFISITIFAFTLWTLKPFGGWTHLELGAGNYGQDGHTKTSQRKTVLMKVTASSKPNYIDSLPIKDNAPYDPNHQFAVLFWTLDELVKRHGSKGVFHVNDLLPGYAQTAAQALTEYAQSKGYSQVQIEVIGGDYNLIQAEETLKHLKLKRYDSIHLKNPEASFFSYRIDGDEIISNQESRRRGRKLLQKLANLSNTGLTFFIINHKNFIPEAESNEYINQNIFYHKTDEWEPVAYYYPEGKVVPKEYGSVFFISNQLNETPAIDKA